MKHLLALIGFCSILDAKDVINDKFLDSVAMIESSFNFDAIGDKGKARGAYQMHKGAWADAEKRLDLNYDWKTFSTDSFISRMYCREYFKILYFQFVNKYHKTPTDIQLYMAYNMGFNGADEYSFIANNIALPEKNSRILTKARYIFSR